LSENLETLEGNERLEFLLFLAANADDYVHAGAIVGVVCTLVSVFSWNPKFMSKWWRLTIGHQQPLKLFLTSMLYASAVGFSCALGTCSCARLADLNSRAVTFTC